MRNKHGLLAIFSHPDDLIAAAKQVRHLKISKMDAYTPFAVHGLDQAMGLKRSWIPWVTLIVGVSGWCLGFLFQAWALSVSWPVNIGGKPPVSWPSFIPVSFESMVLLSGVTTSLIILAMCWPFDFWNGSLDPRLTDDRFGLLIDRRDPNFHETELTKIFKECDAEEIKHIM